MVTNIHKDKLTLATVLGSSNTTRLPLAYVDRGTVQEAFAKGIEAQTHIVVFGTPGVGKSALVRRNINRSDLIFVECLRGQQAPDLYRSILSEVGARVKTETRLSKKRRLSATLKFLGANAERGTENTETEITIDLGNVGDVFRILRSRNDRRRFVLLNNFHLLARGVQRRVVDDLQYVFESTDIRVVILGNWTSHAYLADLNSFLPSFVTDVHVTTWRDTELILVLHKVEQLLNVSFDDDVTNELIARSAGSVRELIDNCRLLLAAVGAASPEASTKVIHNLEQLREISQLRMERLVGRYANFLSSYLTVKLYTTEAVDIGRFLVRVAGDLIARTDDADNGEGQASVTYSYSELNNALTEVVQASNEPPLAERQRRRKLLEELVTAIRHSETNNVSVPLQSVVDADRADRAEEQYALRRSVRTLIKTQAKQGFKPRLLAYDPNGQVLIAMDPKFRVFLRTELGEIDMLQRTDFMRIDEGPRWQQQGAWANAIRETAATRRWLAQEAQ